MSALSSIDDPDVQRRFAGYPEPAATRMRALRQLLLVTAENTDGVGPIEETTKWGEPAYLCKGGTTIRMDHKAKAPEQYALYVSCNTTLIPTFRELYGDVLTFEGNRAIVFRVDEELPIQAVQHCIRLALTYHRVSTLPCCPVHPWTRTCPTRHAGCRCSAGATTAQSIR